MSSEQLFFYTNEEDPEQGIQKGRCGCGGDAFKLEMVPGEVFIQARCLLCNGVHFP